MNLLRFCFLLFAFFTLSFGYAKKKPDIDFDLPKLKGKVRMLVETTDTNRLTNNARKYGMVYKRIYYYNEGGKCTSQTFYQTKGKPRCTIYTYDSTGRKTEEIAYNPILGSGKNDEKTEYKYDSNDTSIEMYIVLPNASKTVIKYNTKGDEIETDEYCLDSAKQRKVGSPQKDLPSVQKFKNVYNDRGLLSKAIIFTNDTFSEIQTYEYDQKGNRTGWRVTNPDSSLRYRIIYGFDKRGNPTEWIQYDKNENVILHSAVKYDKRDNEVLYIWYNKEGEISSKSESKYKYDKVGNWIEKTITNSKGEKLFTTRTIEYY